MKSNIIKNGTYTLISASCKNACASIPNYSKRADKKRTGALEQLNNNLGYKSIYEIVREVVEK